MSSEAAPVIADAAAPEGMYYRVAGNDGVEFKVNELAIQQSETLNRPVTTMSHTAEDVETKDANPVEDIDDEPFLSLVLPEYPELTEMQYLNSIQQLLKPIIEAAKEIAEKNAAEKDTTGKDAEKNVQGTNDSA